MSRQFVFLFFSILLLGCSGDPAPPPDAPQSAAPRPEAAQPAEARISGEEAYMQHCAGCHETGMLGAPVVGEQVDWDHRSQLWQAVLMTHAKEGYLDMPAKGGRPDLPDATVNAAAEYMLELTYPDLPPD